MRGQPRLTAMFPNTRVTSPPALSKALFLPGLRSAVLFFVGGLGLLVLVSLASVGGRPEVWVAGPGMVGLAVMASLGTSAAVLAPLVAAGVAFVVARRLRSGWESLGMGGMQLFAALWPIWVALSLLGALLTFAAEPPAWRLIHQVRGAPLTARMAWADLRGGTVVTLPDGGWIRQGDGGTLRLRSSDGGVRLDATRMRPVPADSAWELESVDAVLGSGTSADGVWTMDRLNLALSPEQSSRYRDPPSSPWAQSPGALWAQRGSNVRAARVWHRRLAQVAAVPSLALLVWVLSFGPVRRSRWHLWAGPSALLGVLGFFGVTSLCASLGPPLVSAWCPVVLALLTSIVWSRR